jgi:hypothetical protein
MRSFLLLVAVGLVGCGPVDEPKDGFRPYFQPAVSSKLEPLHVKKTDLLVGSWEFLSPDEL